MNAFETILIIVYIVAGWWAINKVWFSKRVYLVSNAPNFYVRKFILALFFGWLAIPVAVIMTIIEKAGGK